MVSFLITYASWSGNTREVAECIGETLVGLQHSPTLYQMGSGVLPNPKDYDAMLVGSFTWDQGRTPDEVKDFVLDIGYKPKNTYVFGTGDTQFGGSVLFCRAAERLAKFYETTYKALKIEQSPRGTQEELILNWTKGVVTNWNSLNELKF